MPKLTHKQQKIADFIDEFHTSKGYAPSFREISTHFGFSSLGTVYNHIKALKRKGILKQDSYFPRSLALSLREPENLIQSSHEFPLVATIKEGQRLEWISHPTYLTIPSWMVPKEEDVYLIKIENEGLKEESLLTNDLLVIAIKKPEEGERVLALVEEKFSIIKKLFYDEDFFRFESSSTDIAPYRLRQQHVEIIGVICGIIRLFS